MEAILLITFFGLFAIAVYRTRFDDKKIGHLMQFWPLDADAPDHDSDRVRAELTAIASRQDTRG